MTSEALKVIRSQEPILPKKPPVDPKTLAYRDLVEGPFWQKIPAYKEVSEAQFLDHTWQAKHSITKVQKLLDALQALVPATFIEDAEPGFKHSPMSVRAGTYRLSLLAWADPYGDPPRS